MTESEKYIWVDIAPGRQRLYKKADLEARLEQYGQAPKVVSDTMPPAAGADGHIYDSISEWTKAARREGAEVYTKQELREHKESLARSRALQKIEQGRKDRRLVADLVNDYHLSGKLSF